MSYPTEINDRRANVVLNLPVPAGTLAHQVVALGANGLKGITQTDRATVTTIAAGTAAPGLANGEAAVLLIGVSLVTNTLAVTVAVNQFDKIYLANDGTYNKTNTGLFIGFALDTLAAPGNPRIALLPGSGT